MTSSDVMTTIYNHQSIICLLEFVEKIQREASELQSIFSSPRSPPASYSSDVTEESLTSTEYSSPVSSQHQHFRTNIKSMPYLALKKYYGIPLIATNLRSKSMLGKGQIYLPREGFKKAYSWAEGVVSERLMETDNQQKRLEQLMLNLLFHPQLKQYVRQNTTNKNSTDTASGLARSKPLERKKSREKPLQKVAPHYVKEVVAEVVESAEDDQLKKERKSKARPHSTSRMSVLTKSKATQVEFEAVKMEVETEEAETQYEEIPTCSEEDSRERVERVEISRVLLSGNYCNSNITNFVSNRLDKLGVTDEVWDLFQLVLDDVNSSLTEAKK